jgi:hypothetical protein
MCLCFVSAGLHVCVCVWARMCRRVCLRVRVRMRVHDTACGSEVKVVVHTC